MTNILLPRCPICHGAGRVAWRLRRNGDAVSVIACHGVGMAVQTARGRAWAAFRRSPPMMPVARRPVAGPARDAAIVHLVLPQA